MIDLERFVYESFGKDIDKPSRKDKLDFQLSSLKNILSYVNRNSTFYQKSFQRKEIKIEDVQELHDISNIPFTRPCELRSHPYELLCVSQSAVERVFTLETAGTTGRPKKVFFTHGDLDRITGYMGAAMGSVADWGRVAKGFKVHLFLPNGRPESQAKLLSEGIEKIGARPVVADLSLKSKDQIEKMKEFKPDILFGSVSYIYRMTQESSRDDLEQINPKIIFLTSEYLPESMRKRLEESWNCEVYYHYGMTEMGFAGGVECSAHDGFHFNEGDFLFEIVDPDTGEKLESNEEGELVFTTLNREAMPLLRYKTGDLARSLDSDCECGISTLGKIANSIKRKDGILNVNGESIHYNMLADVVYTIPEILDFEAHLEGKNRLSLRIRAEVTAIEKRIEKELTEAIQNIAAIDKLVEDKYLHELEFELLEKGSLRRKSRIKRSLIDNRG